MTGKYKIGDQVVVNNSKAHVIAISKDPVDTGYVVRYAHDRAGSHPTRCYVYPEDMLKAEELRKLYRVEIRDECFRFVRNVCFDEEPNLKLVERLLEPGWTATIYPSYTR